jgi:hypothetical protein
MSEHEHIAWDIHTARRVLWGTLAVLLIVFVLVVALEVQVQSRNTDIHRVRRSVASLETSSLTTQRAAAQAQAAAEETDQTLRKALDDAKAGSISSAKVLEGLARIQVIEQEINRIEQTLGVGGP